MSTSESHKEAAVALAYQAGRIIRDAFCQNITIDTKFDSSLVTNVDTEINSLVLQTLQTKFPTIPIIAEEMSGHGTHESFVWVCDPLDGTAVFAHGIPACAFSLALVRDGKSILGVVYDPLQRRLFVAEENKGCTLNGRAVHVSSENGLFNTMMGISLWAGSKYDFSQLIPQFKQANILPLNAFSIVYMGMLVASGQLSAAIYLDTHAYDVAALKILVEEAGGKVTDIYGHNQRYDQDVQGCLMSNGILHDTYLGLIKQANYLETQKV